MTTESPKRGGRVIAWPSDGASGGAREGWRSPHTTMVDISSLVLTGSLRSAGEDADHVRRLAGTDAPLPPIVVRRETMVVIDGVHRVRAAQLRGQDTIEVRFFDGPADMAFVLAVETNIAHGLPLSLPDREWAASRILAMHPEWSNRVIARSTGLAANTVASIRRRAGDESQPDSRIGQDGRVRPLDIAAGRRRAAEIIGADPDASLRQIASAAGISVGTARDVRARLRSGRDPVVDLERTRRARTRGAAPADPPQDLKTKLQNVRRDPALRYSEQGRNIVRWLDAHLVTIEDWNAFVNAIPPHSSYAIADLARATATAWRELAEELERRVDLEPI